MGAFILLDFGKDDPERDRAAASSEAAREQASTFRGGVRHSLTEGSEPPLLGEANPQLPL